MPRFKTLDDLEPSGKRVLVRVDFNVPMTDGRVRDATRIDRSLPTIRELLEKGARVILLSHFGRPKGKRVAEMSLRVVVPALEERLAGVRVVFAEDCIGEPARRVVEGLGEGEVALLENLRFHAGEEAGEDGFARALAELGDLYVNDAFAAAHRAHASVEGLPRLLPAVAGRLMQTELEHLEAALERPERPVMALVAGAKVSTKLELLSNLMHKVDVIAIGGGMANTFLHARGAEVGKSLSEPDLAESARRIMAEAERQGCELILPVDVVTAREVKKNVATEVVDVDSIAPDSMALDLGPRTAEAICRRLEGCRTAVWNGPLGVFETPPFDESTTKIARAIVEQTKQGALLSVAGGGDLVAALELLGVAESFSYVSTAGGAFLEWLEGKTLPGVKALEA